MKMGQPSRSFQGRNIDGDSHGTRNWQMRKRNHKSGFQIFFKKVPFIYYLSLFIPYVFHALLRPACETVLCATSNALCLTALFFSPSLQEMTWPPPLAAIQPPGKVEPSKFPFPNKVRSCITQDEYTFLTQDFQWTVGFPLLSFPV